MARILVIDDNQENLNLVSVHPKKAGYEVELESDSENALTRDFSVFDLVLLDIVMPKLTGYEVLKYIRSKLAASELPILMFSALDNPFDTTAAIRIGANDYMVKPLDYNNLLFRIKVLLLQKSR